MSIDSELLVIVCAWCHKVKLTDGTWSDTDSIDNDIASHGICPSCYENTIRKMNS